jgi:hypothetical protein
MKKFKVEIVGSRPSQRRESVSKRLRGKLGTGARAVLLRPRITILTGLIAFVLIGGTPHVGWDYQCRHAVWGTGACQEAVWCEYYGAQGRRVEWPERGERCQLLKILPLDWDALIAKVMT